MAQDTLIRMERREMMRERLHTAKTMFAGALTFAIGVAIIWSFMNADVLYKAIRYPEAVRELDIKVEMSQKGLISPQPQN